MEVFCHKASSSNTTHCYIQNKEKCIAATDAILAGIDAGDKAAVQKAYNDFLAVADIKPAYTGKDKDYTQGYSTEYDWKYKTNKGTIYIR